MMLTTSQLCDYLKVERVFLWRCRKEGMPFWRFGDKVIRYDLSEVLDWFDERDSDSSPPDE